MGPIWGKLLEHLMRNSRALRDAPLVFVAVLVIAFGLSYWVNGLRYEGVLAQKDGTIEGLKVRVSELKDRIIVLEQQPDGVYQLDVQVGSAQSPHVDESKGTVTFGGIIGAAKLNVERDFEYRDFILHVRSFGTETRASIAGQVNRALGQVVCEIVGRVPHQ
jgi:hypothetical protein